MLVGILIFGDNHLLLRGPQPTLEQARAMARHWSVIQLGKPAGTSFGTWSISTKEFREELTWAVAVPGDGARSAAVCELVAEMAARGVVCVEG
jgi:hypothetical protein